MSSVTKVATTLLLATLLALVVVEALVRIFRVPGAEQVPQFVVDRDLGWARQPNQHGFVRQRVPGVFDTWFQTNSRGMRDRERSVDKHGALRILTLGDSVTEGWGVEQEDSYPAQLERRFLRNVEVWNLGVVGYGTDQELQQLRRVIEELLPDVVLLAFFVNDLTENTQSRTLWAPYYVKPRFIVQGADVILSNAPALVDQALVAGRDARTFGPRLNAALKEVALARLMNYGLTALLSDLRPHGDGTRRANSERPVEIAQYWTHYNPYRVAETDEMREMWRLAEQLLVAIDRLCAAHGARFVLTYVPAPIDVIPGMLRMQQERMHALESESLFDVSRLEATLAQIARRHGIPFAEMGTAFRSTAHPEELFLPRVPTDMHIGARGHSLVARTLAGYLQRERVLPTANYAQ